MRFCDKHWEDVVASVKNRGYGYLIRYNVKKGFCSEDAFKSAPRSRAAYDPLVAVSTQLINLSRIRIGYIDGCPLCKAKELILSNCDKAWIEGVADSMRDYCRSQNIRPKRSVKARSIN